MAEAYVCQRCGLRIEATPMRRVRRAVIGYDERQHRATIQIGPITARGKVTFSRTLVGRVQCTQTCSVEFLAPASTVDFVEEWWRRAEARPVTLQFHDGSRRAGEFWAISIELPTKGRHITVKLQGAGDLRHIPATEETADVHQAADAP